MLTPHPTLADAIVQVVFGEVIEGQELVKKIESYGSSSGAPSQSVEILAAGVV